MSKKIKAFAIVILIIALIIGAVAYLSKRESKPATGPLTSSKGAGIANQKLTPSETSEFSSLLSTIKSINIDTAIFSNQAYRTLRDYPIVLGTDVVGRTNPFAPIGIDAPLPDSNQQQLQFETLQPGKITSTTAEFGAQAIGASTVGTNVVFEFGTTNLFGSATSPVQMTRNGTVLFTALGLRPGTTYYVRAVLAQGSKTTVGNTMTFTTLISR